MPDTPAPRRTCTRGAGGDAEPPQNVSLALLREVLHHVNNVAGRVLLRCDTALEGGATERAAALESCAATAEELGRWVREIRARVAAGEAGAGDDARRLQNGDGSS